ncbi:MAG: metallophosphoesterase [Deltaproteobacteria bacterium]|nr:metallophosphoesterase [Deltaproteobacteria bacterium]
MFGTILISIITLVHIYIICRIASVPFVTRYIPRKTLIIIGMLLWIIFFAGRIYGHNHTGIVAVTLEFIGMNWMAIVFLIFVCMLAIDIVTVFGFVMPRLSSKLRGTALITATVFSIIALIQGLRPPVIQNYDVNLSGLPDNLNGKVIVAMSDMHIGSMIGERWLAERVTQVQAEQPDMVVLLGDIFEGHDIPPDKLLSMLGQIPAPLGVWAVLGNHEFHRHRYDQPFFTEETHFKLLRNRWVEITPGFILAGVDDLTTMRRAGSKEDLISKALNRRPPGATILLSHTPWQTDNAANAGVGLMLSGHTHGGQIWPLGYLVRRFYPLLGGRYKVDDMTVIVCRGTGTWGPRMRLWRPGEILRITLYAKSQ